MAAASVAAIRTIKEHPITEDTTEALTAAIRGDGDARSRRRAFAAMVAAVQVTDLYTYRST
jgi:hypothetical protein